MGGQAHHQRGTDANQQQNRGVWYWWVSGCLVLVGMVLVGTWVSGTGVWYWWDRCSPRGAA